MASSFDQLAQSVIKKSLDDCSEEELHNLTVQYPYFAPAQFLYLKKLDATAEAYQKQYQKTALFYSDPVLLEHFIHQDALESVFDLAVPEVKAPENNTPITPTENLTELKPAPVAPSQPAQPKPALENVITFEPFHTVDYFASQGIKLSLEESSKDKFGKQLKSFTEWLKTMKRLPATPANQVKGAAEKQVENLAAHSVQTTEIVTEAMAEVWLHQGNKAKAKEIYRKLSLLNPSKSSYFAAKIEHLNDSN